MIPAIGYALNITCCLRSKSEEGYNDEIFFWGIVGAIDGQSTSSGACTRRPSTGKSAEAD
jgi:hypothetical protein